MILFANRYGAAASRNAPLAEQCADSLENYSKKPNAEDAHRIARILVDAAKAGDSSLYRALAGWIDAAKGTGERLDRRVVLAWTALFLTLYDVEGRGRPTASDMQEELRLNGVDASLRTIQGCLAEIEGPGRAGRRKSARSS
jgi:hypothetical protein